MNVQISKDKLKSDNWADNKNDIYFTWFLLETLYMNYTEEIDVSY